MVPFPFGFHFSFLSLYGVFIMVCITGRPICASAILLFGRIKSTAAALSAMAVGMGIWDRTSTLVVELMEDYFLLASFWEGWILEAVFILWGMFEILISG